MNTEWSQHRILFQVSSRELWDPGERINYVKSAFRLCRDSRLLFGKLYYLISPTPTTPAPLVLYLTPYPLCRSVIRRIHLGPANHRGPLKFFGAPFPPPHYPRIAAHYHDHNSFQQLAPIVEVE